MAREEDIPGQALLRRIPLFANLSLDELEHVRAEMAPTMLHRGDYLFHQGDPGDALHVVQSGMVEAVIDEGLASEQIVGTFGAGEFLGEVALLTGQPRTAAIRARSDSRLLTLSQASFVALLERYPLISLLMNRVLSNRLRATNEHMSRRSSWMSVVAPLHVSDDTSRAVAALLESISRQLGAAGGIVFLGDEPLPGFDGSRSEFVSPHQIQALTVSRQELEDATDATIRARVHELRSHVAHAVICASPDVLLSRPGTIDRATRVLLLHDDSTRDEAARLQGELAAAIDGTVRSVAVRDIEAPIQIDRYARLLTGTSIGLALSGGAAQGTAHVGVMRALLEAGLPIDLIAGASGGALYGSMVAAGIPVTEVQEIVIAHTRRNLWDRADIVVPRFGLMSGKRIERMLRETLDDRRFTDLLYPLSVIATDLADGSEVVLDQGPVYQAVRASIGIPGVFVPYVLDGRLLVDGALVNPLPVGTARAMGADFVIAVHVPAPGQVTQSQRRLTRGSQDRYNLLSTVVRSFAFAGDVLAERSAVQADICIRPQVAHFGWRDYRSSPLIIRAGYEAGRTALAHIQKIVPIKLPSPVPP